MYTDYVLYPDTLRSIYDCADFTALHPLALTCQALAARAHATKAARMAQHIIRTGDDTTYHHAFPNGLRHGPAGADIIHVGPVPWTVFYNFGIVTSWLRDGGIADNTRRSRCVTQLGTQTTLFTMRKCYGLYHMEMVEMGDTTFYSDGRMCIDGVMRYNIPAIIDNWIPADHDVGRMPVAVMDRLTSWVEGLYSLVSGKKYIPAAASMCTTTYARSPRAYDRYEACLDFPGLDKMIPLD